ncbi:MAG: hypothetical protein IJD48_00585 [Clostridia bacterium]|nr:hypothetical protein [Clostridia bacterium]
MRKKSFHIWRLLFACFILATIGFFCVQGNFLINICSKIFVRADVLSEYSNSQALAETQQLSILSVTAKDREFNGELAVETIVEVSGVDQGDDATVICKAEVLSPEAGNNKYVAISNFDIVGADKDKYFLPTEAEINIGNVFVNILPKKADLVWVTQTDPVQYTYNGRNQISTVSAYYKDINNKKNAVEISVRGYSLSGETNFVGEFEKAGNYIATAIPSNQDSNYILIDDDGDQKLNLKMNRAKSSIKILSDISFVYNGLMQDASICAVIDNNEQTLVFKNNTFTTVGEGLAINQSGGVSVMAPQSDNYLEVAESFFEIKVSKAVPTIDVSNVKTNYEYNGERQYVDGATIDNDVQSLTYKNNSFVSVSEGLAINRRGGVYVYAEETENYAYAEKYININVEKKALDITKTSFRWTDLSFLYNGKQRKVEIIDYSNLLYKIDYENNEKTDAGSYVAKAIFTLRDPDNYSLPVNTLIKEWSISKLEVRKPVVKTYTSTYIGSEQVLPVDNNIDYYVINNTQTNAGTYKLSYVLNDKSNTIWADDKTTNDVNFVWIINKAQVATPTYKSALVYNGKKQNLSFQENDIYSILQNSQVETGNYKTFLVLKDSKNYEWKDNPNSAYLVLNWSIVENENYNQNTPTIAIAFMVSLVILSLLYATLHFTSVRRRRKKITPANTTYTEQALKNEVVKDEIDLLAVGHKIEEEQSSQQNEETNQTDVETEQEQFDTEENIEESQADLEVEKDVKIEEIVENDVLDNQEQTQQAVNLNKSNETVEKSRKKRMLSRKKADKKRKRRVVEEVPRKRGRPKKTEQQKSVKKRVTKKYIKKDL